jgi:hypothetical protein
MQAFAQYLIDELHLKIDLYQLTKSLEFKLAKDEALFRRTYSEHLHQIDIPTVKKQIEEVQNRKKIVNRRLEYYKSYNDAVMPNVKIFPQATGLVERVLYGLDYKEYVDMMGIVDTNEEFDSDDEHNPWNVDEQKQTLKERFIDGLNVNQLIQTQVDYSKIDLNEDLDVCDDESYFESGEDEPEFNSKEYDY